MPDAVVIGAGPNGLAAANVLAARGWTVAVLEAQSQPGGAVRSAELIEPGYTNDLFSSFYPLAVASPVFGAMDLADHGLRWCRSPLALAHPTLDGSCPVVSSDLDETCASLDAGHPGDGDRWRDLYSRWQRLEPSIIGALTGPFPPVRAGLRLVGSIPPSELPAFVRFALLPVRRMGEEEFRGEQARRLMAGNALHADFSPEAAISGFFGWLLMGLAQGHGFPVPEGGAGSLTAALVARMQSHGATLTCDAPVTSVVIRRGRAVGVRLADGTEVEAKRAVIADVAAPSLFLDLVGEQHLPASYLEGIRRFQWDLATVKVDWNLDGPIPWSSPEARRAGTVHVADSVDALTMGTAALSTGQIPDRPFLLVGQQSMVDPTRQPAGKESAWAYTHVPQHVRGDVGGEDLRGVWDERETEVFVARMEHEIEMLAPGFGALIRGRHVFTPSKMEAADANLRHGAINGGTAQLHQQLVFRPVPGAGRPGTPVKGLFLGSASAHPGGGVHGACGANAARAAIAAEWRRAVPFRR
ncbi:MAG: Phytoene dehydrogenase and related proteins [uncultured Acidimicrobiales bacterium]|uniref:Pyridine nucleotide-disulfide oxidoreductase domain-containing protein 2 n=1 Tax=uncultured Acidimicrobiales bacterium TaxID=310071 RepID=A0A6J4HQ34_9ACTN|nr:MAG: Phytoene dehydrogenase and related proteins [uncultured Acidimicrobiales bacterium]